MSHFKLTTMKAQLTELLEFHSQMIALESIGEKAGPQLTRAQARFSGALTEFQERCEEVDARG